MSKQENKTKTAVSQKSYCTADEAIPTPLLRELDCLLLGFPKLWKRCNGE
jgi:hypothetical protein